MDKLYAIEGSLEVPGVLEHWLRDDGLTFESTFIPESGGRAVSRVSWDNLEKAEANYENARLAVIERVGRFAARIDELDYDETDTSRLHTLLETSRGKLRMIINTGPPTWWRPRADAKGSRIRFGWLRVAVVFSWDRK